MPSVLSKEESKTSIFSQAKVVWVGIDILRSKIHDQCSL